MESKRFYTTEQLSEHMATTPEGFLVCFDVPITRVGVFEYKANEVPIEGNGGLVKIQRGEDQVFSEETIKSFEGKPVTINHPNDFVTPENWKDLAHGTLQNVRRGEGEESDLLIADLCLTTSDAISLVKAGLRQVSCGYDAQYEQVKPGLGRQKDIIGNHLALVVKGRAGNRCAIMDKACSCCGNCMCGEKNQISKEGNCEMSNKSKVKDVLHRMFPKLNLDSVKDEDLELGAEGGEAGPGTDLEAAQQAAAEAKIAAVQAVEAAKQAQEAVEGIGTNEEHLNEENLDQEGGEAGADPIAALNAKLDAIQGLLQQLIDALGDGEEISETSAEVGEGGEAGEELMAGDEGEEQDLEDEMAKTKDGMWQDTISRADIIAPGIIASKPKAGDTKKVVIAVKRKALSDGMTKDHAAIIKPLLRGKKIGSLTEDALDAVFVAASEMIGKVNNAKLQRRSIQMKDLSSYNDLAKINARNKEFWAKK